MSICYLCFKCRRQLKIQGFDAVNEVGRKYCERCGSNEDDLHVIGKEEYNKSLNSDGKKHSAVEK